MRKYGLSAAASVLILVVMLSSIAPAMASYPSSVTLEVTATAMDDSIRRTGIIVFYYSKPAGWPLTYQPGSDFVAHYTFTVKLTGLPTNPTGFVCQVVMMNKVNLPYSFPPRQFGVEIMKTVPVDKSANFVAKSRWVSPGVGALDVYYIGPVTPDQIGDYMLVISAWWTVGKVTIWGTCEQKLCILGFSMGSAYLASMRPDGTTHYSWDDALGPFASCEEAVWWQRRYLGVPISTG